MPINEATIIAVPVISTVAGKRSRITANTGCLV
jgi:hypothetical protein